MNKIVFASLGLLGFAAPATAQDGCGRTYYQDSCDSYRTYSYEPRYYSYGGCDSYGGGAYSYSYGGYRGSTWGGSSGYGYGEYSDSSYGRSAGRRFGNNGVGNGYDPQPPGNPPINDGWGTGRGNPGRRYGGRTRNW